MPLALLHITCANMFCCFAVGCLINLYAKPISQLRFDYDTMIRRCIQLRWKWSQLRYAFDLTVMWLLYDMYRTCLLPFDAICREQKKMKHWYLHFFGHVESRWMEAGTCDTSSSYCSRIAIVIMALPVHICCLILLVCLSLLYFVSTIACYVILVNNRSFSRSLIFIYDSAFYLRQVNRVNGRDTVFVRCVSVYVCVCVQQTGQSDEFKTVKATDFKFDVHVPRDSPDMIP